MVPARNWTSIPPAASEELMTSAQSILVIDDQRDFSELISAKAESMGIPCTATSDATTFLNSLTPDITLIVLDLIMPDVDGIELLRLLAKRECRAGIVLMSGVSKRVMETAQQVAQSLGLAIVGHLQKPFRLTELGEMLSRPAKPYEAPAVQQESPPGIQDDELRRAIVHDEFVLHYQPQIDLARGNVVGVEALARWQHPERGLIFPGDFIAHLEAVGLMDQFGWIVIDKGLSEVGQFADICGAVPMLSLNVSVLSLRNLKFPDIFMALVKKHGASAANLTIEITESGLIQELPETLDVLTRLRMKEVQLSIDDFGTGFAMLQQLRNIPATELKIDKSFVQQVQNSERDRVMVQKSIEIGHDLGMTVIGEGAETQEQFEFLRANHCDTVQGYFFSRPLPVPKLLDWLKEYRMREPAFLF
jgi:EAL domain-containing protein (putative c-di-GMP-specific phosphodiesterase class I)/FixJ family two-component response regulator